MPTCQFSHDDIVQANADWGCNCGPAALAFALQTGLDDVRPAMMAAGFGVKGHTTPTMMSAALVAMNAKKRQVQVPVRNAGGGLDIEPLFVESLITLVRVQWTGPWTRPGTSPRWAYAYTHWIATWAERGVPLVFDCNGGVQHVERWEYETVPAITSQISRADGGWHPTHVWHIAKNRI
jgi:hypothetical protein